LQKDDDTMVAVSAPAWKWEWNINTLVILLGFIAGIAAWGATWQRVTSSADTNRGSIDRLDTRLTAIELLSRRFDNHELRIGNLERQATDATSALRAVEATLNGLTGDVKVVREILQRIEAGQSVRRPP
jgi:hypothetical protein